MKHLIQKLLREGLDEVINLNLSKQIRGKQKDMVVDKMLEDIFGKNVYRLYYDVVSGKQITPTKSTPKINFDLEIENTLANSIKGVLNRNDYNIVDLENNVAEKDGRQIKISKVLNSIDDDLLGQYTDFLDKMTNKVGGNKKLYVVISRHSHDIANMSSHKGWQSCEKMSGVDDIGKTNIPDTLNYKTVDSDGNGVYTGGMLLKGGLIFYLIEEGDWGVQNPLGRFTSGIYCENNSGSYKGKYSQSFKGFVTQWLDYYVDKVMTPNLKNHLGYPEGEQNSTRFSEMSSEELYDTLSDISGDNRINLIRYLITNNRFEVLIKRFNESPDRFIDNLIISFGYKVFTQLSPELINNIKEFLSKKLDKLYSDALTYSRTFTKSGVGELYTKVINDKKLLYHIGVGRKVVNDLIPDSPEYLSIGKNNDKWKVRYYKIFKKYQMVDQEKYDKLLTMYRKIEQSGDEYDKYNTTLNSMNDELKDMADKYFGNPDSESFDDSYQEDKELFSKYRSYQS